MSASSAAGAQSSPITFGSIARTALLAIVLSVVANLLVRIIAFALLPIPAEFPPLGWAPPILFTVIGVLAAFIVFAVLARTSRRPVQVFRIVALVALLLSLIPDLLILMNPSPALPGTTVAGVVTLMLMHMVAWTITITLIARLARP